MHLFLSDQEKYSFRVADFFYYYARAKGRFESYLQKLLEIPCGTVEQMKLVNTFCWLDEYASHGIREAV